jgi:hypothetical protein
MAPSQFLSKPQGTTPPTPAIVAPDENPGEPSFQFTCDDYDHDRDHDHDHDRDHQTTIDPPVANTPERRPSLSPAALLHPHHSPSLRPPTPESTFAMATEDGLANVGSNGPTAKNPFNFQTQFISAGPVKSVRGYLSLLTMRQSEAVVDGISAALKSDQLTNFPPILDYWATTRPPLQTQLDKRTTPNLPRTTSATTSRTTGLPSHTNPPRSMG